MALSLHELEKRNRKLSLIIANLLKIPVDDIFNYTENDTLEGPLANFIDPVANEAVADRRPTPLEDAPPEEPPPEEIPE